MKQNVFTPLALLSAVLLLTCSGLAQSDPMGEIDEFSVLLKETANPDHWEIVLNFTNDEPLFGMVFPLLIRSDKGKLRYDSTSFAGSRIENFAVKIPFEDTSYTNKGEGLKINLGLIGSVGPERVELLPGSGLIAKHYVTAIEKGVTTKSIVVDTTFIQPANHVMGTMIDSRTNVKPTFTFERAGEEKKKK